MFHSSYANQQHRRRRPPPPPPPRPLLSLHPFLLPPLSFPSSSSSSPSSNYSSYLSTLLPFLPLPFLLFPLLLLLHTGTSDYLLVQICVGMILVSNVLLQLLQTWEYSNFLSYPILQNSGHCPLPRIRQFLLPHMNTIFLLSRYNHLSWYSITYNRSIFHSSVFCKSTQQLIPPCHRVSFYPAIMQSKLKASGQLFCI